jgi:acetyl-CoA carboxylase carboxyltransferase component
VPSRLELEQRVDELAEQHSGEEFADAVRRYAETLDADGQEELQSVLMERARLLDDAVAERYRHRGWLRRMLDRVEEIERRAGSSRKPEW